MTKIAGSGSRIRIQDPDPNPDPDSLVRGMDPLIRIRIHPKMSWIRNTGENGVKHNAGIPTITDKNKRMHLVVSILTDDTKN
jgi:hypothetical protein